MADIVIVTGTRKLKHAGIVEKHLDRLDPGIVVQGGAMGADEFAHRWCKRRGRISITVFPDYSSGDGAPLRRNVQMLEGWSEATVLGFPAPDSRGTRYTISQARKRLMTVEVVEVNCG